MVKNLRLNKKKQKSFNVSMKKNKNVSKMGKVKVMDKKKQAKGRVNVSGGIVYLSSIPHGFYEEQMRGYFGQFGKVRRIRMARSKKTGRSKGYAFIEFIEAGVAEIVAQTMNNYLMDKRLIKAKYMPADEVTKKMFQGREYTPHNFPSKTERANVVAKFNATKSDEAEIISGVKLLNRIKKIRKTLTELGIEWTFEAVDVPDDIFAKANKINKKVRNEESIESPDETDEGAELSPDIQNTTEESFSEEKHEETSKIKKTPNNQTPNIKNQKKRQSAVKSAQQTNIESVTPQLRSNKKNSSVKDTPRKSFGGITKKPKQIIEKNMKKLDLMKQEAISGEQINLKTLEQVKKKKTSPGKQKKQK